MGMDEVKNMKTKYASLDKILVLKELPKFYIWL